MSNVEPWNIATELTSPAGTERIHAQGAEPNDYYVTTSTLAAYAQTGMATDAEVATAVSDHAAASDPHGDRTHASGLVSTHSADTTSVHGITDTSALLDTGDIGTTVQGYSAVLAATTASFTTADETKLDGIEAGADVTDATNVAAAGAVMASLVDAKGDLIVATAADAVARLPVGATNGHVLTVDSAEASGVKWAAASGGGGGVSRALPHPVSYTRADVWPATNLFLPLSVRNGSTSSAGASLAQRPFWWPVMVDRPVRLVKIATYCWTGEAGAYLRVGLFACDDDFVPTTLIEDFGTGLTGSSTGAKTITVSRQVDSVAALCVWPSNHSTVRWSKPAAASYDVFGESSPAGGGTQIGWRLQSETADYSAGLPTERTAGIYPFSTAQNPIVCYLGWEEL